MGISENRGGYPFRGSLSGDSILFGAEPGVPYLGKHPERFKGDSDARQLILEVRRAEFLTTPRQFPGVWTYEFWAVPLGCTRASKQNSRLLGPFCC